MFLATLILIISVSMFLLGYSVGKTGNFLDYFRSPSDNTLELDWGLRQLFLVFSKQASENWYEARAHMRLSVPISLMATFGLLYAVRVEYMIDDCRGRSVIYYFHGFRSFQELEQLLISRNGWEEPVEPGFMYHQTFVAGHNVIHDAYTPF